MYFCSVLFVLWQGKTGGGLILRDLYESRFVRHLDWQLNWQNRYARCPLHPTSALCVTVGQTMVVLRDLYGVSVVSMCASVPYFCAACLHFLQYTAAFGWFAFEAHTRGVVVYQRQLFS